MNDEQGENDYAYDTGLGSDGGHRRASGYTCGYCVV